MFAWIFTVKDLKQISEAPADPESNDPIQATESILAFKSKRQDTLNLSKLEVNGKIAAGSLKSVKVQGLLRNFHISPLIQRGVYLIAANDQHNVSISAVDEFMMESPIIVRNFEMETDHVKWNPRVYNLFGFASSSQIGIAGVDEQQPAWTCSVNMKPEALDWKDQGDIIGCAFSSGVFAVYDPRLQKQAMELTIHDGIKPRRFAWIEGTGCVFTTGFNKRRDREYALWDLRNSKSPITRQKVDTSTGILTPHYDSDTGLLFLVGKGDMLIRWMEVKSSSNIESSGLFTNTIPFNCGQSVSASAMVPKQALDVMKCEVDKLLLLSSDGNSILPVSITVPRKNTTVFHADIFPDVKSNEASLTFPEWSSGNENPVIFTSLDPAKRRAKSVTIIQETTKNLILPINFVNRPNIPESQMDTQPSEKVLASYAAPLENELKPGLNLQTTSSYRFISGKAATIYTDVKNIDENFSLDCDLIKSNVENLFFPLSGPGGRIAVLPRKGEGRLAIIPSIVNGRELGDFQCSPFNNELAAGCVDGTIRFWNVPLGFKENMVDSPSILSAHSNRISMLKYHPTISNLMLSISTNSGKSELKLWNLKTRQEVRYIENTETVLAACFDFSGKYLVTASRDRMLRLFDITKGVLETLSHDGIKGARIQWLGNTSCFCTFGYGKGSQRELILWDSNGMEMITKQVIDVSPAMMGMHYDEDTRLLFLCSRGEGFVYIYEIQQVEGKPTRFYSCSRYESPSKMFGFEFLPKTECDVKNVEVDFALVLMRDRIERVSFSVPRIKYFQDDLFPPTRDRSRSAIDVDQWMADQRCDDFVKIDLCPLNMRCLSGALEQEKAKKATEHLANRETSHLSPEELKNQMISSIFELVDQCDDEEEEKCTDTSDWSD